MTEWLAYCEECDEEYKTESEEGALGWMFGHGIRTEHYETFKEKL